MNADASGMEETKLLLLGDVAPGNVIHNGRRHPVIEFSGILEKDVHLDPAPVEKIYVAFMDEEHLKLFGDFVQDTIRDALWKVPGVGNDGISRPSSEAG